MKKSLTFLIICSLLLCIVPAQAESDKTFVMMGLEKSDESRNWSESLFFERMAEKTDVSFTFQQYADDVSYQAAKDEAFSSGNLPDVLFKANLTPEEEMAYYESGQLVDLTPYLEEYAPNVYAILEARPDWRAIITQPNGAITSLPSLNGAERQCCLWINTAWLEALGLKTPATLDEFTDVLRAIRDGDPNGNGRADEIPLTLIGPWEAKYMLHAFGIVANDYNLFVDTYNTVQYAPALPEYRYFVEWLKMTLSESLIDADAFRQSPTARSNALSTAEDDAPLTYGSMVALAPYSYIDLDKTMDFSALAPLSHNGEDGRYRQLLNGVGRGAFAVTSACEDIPAVLSWVDVLYTEEGGRLAYAGLEDTDYVIKDDGTWYWDVDGDYYAMSDLVTTATISGDVMTPGLEPAAFMRRSEIEADNYTRRQVDAIRDSFAEPFPVTWPTDAAREERIAELHTELATCVDKAIANFAMGIVELDDDNWAAFHKELEEIGLEEFVSLWQAKYDELG